MGNLDRGDTFFIGYLIGVVCLGIVFWVISPIGRMESNAVRHGCAEWVIDSTDGDTEFKWKDK